MTRVQHHPLFLIFTTGQYATGMENFSQFWNKSNTTRLNTLLLACNQILHNSECALQIAVHRIAEIANSFTTSVLKLNTLAFRGKYSVCNIVTTKCWSKFYILICNTAWVVMLYMTDARMLNEGQAYMWLTSQDT